MKWKERIANILSATLAWVLLLPFSLGTAPLMTACASSHGAEQVPDGETDDPVDAAADGSVDAMLEDGIADGTAGDAGTDAQVDEEVPSCECTPGDVRQGATCGNCGIQQQLCSPLCVWGDWTCVDQGCQPGTIQNCNQCGQQECNALCQWGPCESIQDFCQDGAYLQDCNPDGSCVTQAPTITDYWNGAAEWKFLRKLTQAGTGWTPGFEAGVHVETLNNQWYLFTRKVRSGQTTYDCGPFGEMTLGVEVRSSSDQGQTWSSPVDAILPQQGTAWACAGTDGDTWYDPVNNQWHFLFQCYSTTHVWNGCHLVRQGPDPMGIFNQTHANPSLSGGLLWNAICDTTMDDCVAIPGGTGRVHDEGTFDIFHHDGAFFYISFHGYDGLRGYRGIARTPDFVNWGAGDLAQQTPLDAIFDRLDSQPWRESWIGESIGGGAARIVQDAGYYYMLVEAADINLGCTPGQHWDFGLLRSDSFANTTWEQFPLGNPIIYSATNPGDFTDSEQSMRCNIQYAGIFTDPASDITYLHFSRLSKDPGIQGIYFYQLVRNNNLLRNGDLWMCSTDHFNTLPIGPTNLVVYRHPGESSEGTCYLATNCGTNPDPCQTGQSIYQDVDVSGLTERHVSYGGKFATAPGTQDGPLRLALHELDTAHHILDSHIIDVQTASEYQTVRAEVDLQSQTAILRYELYLLSAMTTYRADEMFVRTRVSP